MKKEVIILFGIIILMMILGGCNEVTEQAISINNGTTKIEETKSKIPKSAEDIPNEILKTICLQEEWPRDCGIIPVAEGRELCKRCKSMLPEDYQYKEYPGPSQQGLGSLCTGMECEKFCKENPELCREYCSSHPENENCHGLGPKTETGPVCSDGTITFDYPPVNLDKTSYIEPMGSLHGEHVAPIDHQYYKNFNNDKPSIEVYSPSDGMIKEIQHMGSFRGDRNWAFDDYRLTIEHTCAISTFFIHIDKLPDKIREEAPEFGEYKKVDIPVKAGEIIGWYDNSVDFNVADTAITINLIEPQSYKHFPQRLHIQDPFNYFNEPIKSQLIAKSLRAARPEGGFIDYDIDGKLIGTWFGENTNGWVGLNQERYWADHLAIIYDSIDPEHILFSVGTFKGKAQQFGVKGNAPKPDEVSVDTGLVKYELVDYQYYDGNTRWDYKNLVKGLKVKNENQILGVALLQMLEDRKLKVEVFPDKTAAQVNRFTENSKIYVR